MYFQVFLENCKVLTYYLHDGFTIFFFYFSITGNVFETRGLDELIPNWRELDAPISTKVTEDAFLFLSEDKSVQIPNVLLPPQLVGLGCMFSQIS